MVYTDTGITERGVCSSEERGMQGVLHGQAWREGVVQPYPHVCLEGLVGDGRVVVGAHGHRRQLHARVGRQQTTATAKEAPLLSSRRSMPRMPWSAPVLKPPYLSKSAYASPRTQDLPDAALVGDGRRLLPPPQGQALVSARHIHVVSVQTEQQERSALTETDRETAHNTQRAQG